MTPESFEAIFESWDLRPTRRESLGGTAFRWSEYCLWIPGQGDERMATLTRKMFDRTVLVMAFAEPSAFSAWLNAVDTP